jgi:hypothetical protein
MTVCIYLHSSKPQSNTPLRNWAFWWLPPWWCRRARGLLFYCWYISRGWSRSSTRLQKSNKFLERLPYDVMAIGKWALSFRLLLVPAWTDSFTSIAMSYTSMRIHMTCGSWIFWAEFGLTDDLFCISFCFPLLCSITTFCLTLHKHHLYLQNGSTLSDTRTLSLI